MNNQLLHRIKSFLFLAFSVLIVFIACEPKMEPVYNPLLLDRTEEWASSIPFEIRINMISISKKQTPFIWRFLSREELFSYKAEINTEEDVLIAAKEVLSSHYQEESILDEMVQITTNDDNSLWFINYLSYYLIFDRQGYLVMNINAGNYSDIKAAAVHTVIISIDLAKASKDNLIALSNESYCTISQLEKHITALGTKQNITVEDAFTTAVDCANHLYMRSGYDSEFRIYQNDDRDCWIILSSNWLLLLNKQDGAHIFSGLYSFSDDQSVCLSSEK